MVFGAGIDGYGKPLALQIRLGVDWVKLLFNLGGHGEERLDQLRPFRLLIPVPAEPDIQLRMEVGHNPGEARRPMAQGIQNGGGVGVKKPETAPFDELQPPLNQGGVAAGILEEVEPPRPGGIGNLAVGDKPLIGVRALVKAQGKIAGEGGKDLVQAVPPDLRGAALFRQAVGDQDNRVHAGIRHPLQLINLVVDAVGGVSGGNHRHMGGPFDKAGKLHPLLKTEEKHLAGLADGEQAADAPLLIPLDEGLQGLVVHPPCIGKGGEHYRPYAVLGFGFHCFTSSLIKYDRRQRRPLCRLVHSTVYSLFGHIASFRLLFTALPWYNITISPPLFCSPILYERRFYDGFLLYPTFSPA